jgi:ADP-ribose pyrophosphatase YjhB (NUDIX family)
MSLLGVTIAIVVDGQVLLTKRRDFAVWCLPGGALEDGESLAQAAIREAREETGLEVRLTRLVGVYSRPNWRAGGAHETLFCSEPTGGELLTVTNETTGAGYFAPDALPKPLLRWHYSRIADALDGRAGTARRQDVTWPTEIRDRQELYQWRDQGHLPMQAFIERFCGPPEPGQDVLEVE